MDLLDEFNYNSLTPVSSPLVHGYELTINGRAPFTSLVIYMPLIGKVNYFVNTRYLI